MGCDSGDIGNDTVSDEYIGCRYSIRVDPQQLDFRDSCIFGR